MSGKITLCAFLGAAVLAFGACSSDHTPAPPTCSYSTTVSTQSFSATGGTGSVVVTTGSTCAWTAAADSPWVTFSGASGGTGPGTLSFAVSANAATDTRRATLTVAGQAISVSQVGRAACQYAVTPASQTVAPEGGSVAFAIATASDCSWTATTADPWATVTSGASGTGNGTATISVAAYSGSSDRQTSATVAGQPVTLRQTAPPPPPPPPVACDYSVSPVDLTEHWHATGREVTVNTSNGCTWSVTSTESWIGINKTGGSGPGTIQLTFGTFTEDATRRAAVQVRWPTETAGQNVWVTQEGCRYGFGPATASFPSTGGRGRVDVVTQPISSSCNIGCPWTVTSPVSWIHITSSMPRAGDDPFFYDVDPNTGPSRTATLIIAGKTHIVTQQ